MFKLPLKVGDKLISDEFDTPVKSISLTANIFFLLLTLYFQQHF